MVERILELMKSKGVKAKDVTEHAGLGHGAITNWKTGRSKPNMDAIIKLATYFGVSADYLLFGKEHDKISTTKISNSAVAQGVNAKAVNGNQNVELSSEAAELLRVYNSIDVKKRIKLLECAFKLEEE